MRWFGRTVLALAAAAFLTWGWYHFSAWWTLHQIRRAALAGDVDRLAEFVDYQELRRHRAAELKVAMDELLATTPRELRLRIIAETEWRRLEGNRNFDPDVTPEDLLIMFGRNPGYWGWASGKRETGRRDAIELRRPDRFHVLNRRDHYPDPQGDLTFRREGLGWKLVRIRATQEEFPEEPPAWRLHQWLGL